MPGLTPLEKAEAVLAAFRGEVQCVNCGIDTTKQDRVTRYHANLSIGTSRCLACDRLYMMARMRDRENELELTVGPDYVEESAPWP